MKNIFYKLLTRLISPWIPKHRGERFLIVSTTALGDTLWATPALHNLRSSYPNAYIAVLTSPIGTEALKNNRHLTEIFTTHHPWPLLRKKIATILIFHTSQRWVLPFCTLLGASRIIGTQNGHKGLDALLTDALPNPHTHEIERRLQLLKMVGAKTDFKSIEVFPSELDFQNGAVSHNTVALHPGSKDRFKQWPPSHFIRLGHLLQKKLGCSILITGTPQEKQLLETIAKAIPGAKPVYHMPLLSFAALISKLSLFITNDTGSLHLAAATKTPTIALFTPTDHKLCGPYFAPHIKVIQKTPTCFPCLRKKCCEPFCMLQITPEEVLEQISVYNMSGDIR
jgi:ADP-heptose:LPS heptosyltransferase